MLIRVLVAVLTLLGPLPVRFCTCGAAWERSEPVCSSATPPTVTKHCRCSYVTASLVPLDGEAAEKAPTHLGVASPKHPHEPAHTPDCPAISSQIVREVATPTQQPILPHVDEAALVGSVIAFDLDAPDVTYSAFHIVPLSAPRYLTLRVLRI